MFSSLVIFFLQIGMGGNTPPRVFFVRAANKGLMVDAASRASKASRKEKRSSVESLNLKEEKADLSLRSG